MSYICEVTGKYCDSLKCLKGCIKEREDGRSKKKYSKKNLRGL